MKCLQSERFKSRLRIAAVAMGVLTLAGCKGQEIEKHLRPLSYATVAQLKAQDMSQESPLLVRIFKEESELEIWKQTRSGRFEHFKTYDICAWSGELGPKRKEGDRQAPEGFYTVTPAQMNPNSSYHLSFNIGYPNTFDRAHGRTGTHLMVHGACSSAGCYSMTDESVQEIYSLAREAFRGGQRDFQVQALPFRMSPENMAKHAGNPNMPFWQNLKEGVDHFEVTGRPPEVGVCDRTYVFNATPANGQRMDPGAVCPQLEVPTEIRMAVASKQAKDQAAFQVAMADRLADQAGETRPSEGGLLARIMVAGNSTPLEEQGSSDGYSEPVQVAMSPDAAAPATQPAAAPEMRSAMVEAAPAAETAATEPFASAFTGVWSRIVDMTRSSGLGEPEAELQPDADPIETGAIPGQPQAAAAASLRSAYAPRLFAADPFSVFKMFETVDGVSVPADTVQR